MAGSSDGCVCLSIGWLRACGVQGCASRERVRVVRVVVVLSLSLRSGLRPYSTGPRVGLVLDGQAGGGRWRQGRGRGPGGAGLSSSTSASLGPLVYTDSAGELR